MKAVMKQWMFLFLLLAFPAILYLFLQEFGKNEYNIPMLYENGAEGNECVPKSNAPYKIPDSVRRIIGGENKSVVVITEDSPRNKEAAEEIEKKIVGKLGAFVFLSSLSEAAQKKALCFLMMQKSANAVLIDKKNRIRGYYQLSKKKECERLQDELSILFTRKK
ncbi:MAG: hypothetical protein CRN43_16260 [Candidatus Nephrothrix sp. EaCA]|nr:MAG: hypothetical protein CRN43_16260 [Candidatus Nephrothrix sp. EaCA]